MPPTETACFDRSVGHVHRALGYGLLVWLAGSRLCNLGVSPRRRIERRDLGASGLDAEAREPRRRVLMLPFLFPQPCVARVPDPPKMFASPGGHLILPHSRSCQPDPS